MTNYHFMRIGDAKFRSERIVFLIHTMGEV